MANTAKSSLLTWLEDDGDDSLDIIDFLTGLSGTFASVSHGNELIGALQRSREATADFDEENSGDYFIPAAEAVAAAVAVGAGTQSAIVAAEVKPLTHVWDEPAIDEEFTTTEPKEKAQKSKTSKQKAAVVFAEAAQVVEDWHTSDFGIHEDSRPLGIFDMFAEHLVPEI
ncbi:MAG: hypothetical protein LBJ12_01790 [Oscillospiraceae bacterium]|jgi:hypothetical protein|nr:hypothetical protein [Oscillospiraceae bacterium]